jgi:hypothetical protein
MTPDEMSSTHSKLAASPRAMVVAALLVAPLVGCVTSGGDDGDDTAGTGQLTIPLVQPGSHGELYHLANATFDVTPPHAATFTIDGTGAQSEIDLSLPPGVVTIQLHDGWVLERSDDGGVSFQPVSALLGTFNPVGARVLANQPVIIEFGFVIRDTSGTAQITLGVVPDPRELAGAFIINSATGDLEPYATMNRNLDFAVFFQLASQQLVTLPDGTKQRIYTAGPFSIASPFSSGLTPVAAEIYNDTLGVLSASFSQAFMGAFLQYTVAAKPDGSVELSGLLQGDDEIDFGPNAINADVPPIDADGFPADTFFYDSNLPFTMTAPEGTITGQLRMRHLLPRE